MRRLRGKHGNFLEDFRVGEVFRHRVGKTITEGLLATFTEWSMTTNPLSKNRRYAERYGFRGLVAPPALVMNVVFSQSVADISENSRANLEYIDMRFGAPVYVGDTIEAWSMVLGVRPSRRHGDRGVVHVQTTGVNQRGEVVLTYQRKVQVWRERLDAPVAEAAMPEPPVMACELTLPPYEPGRRYAELAYLTSPDTYLEDFLPGDVIEHTRGRVITSEHVALTAMLDNTAQIHCNQWMVEQSPERYLGGKLVVYGGIPFAICLGLSCPDVWDNALAELCFPNGRHTGPVFVGDTIFATTEVRAVRDYPGRPDLGVLVTTLRGYKYAPLRAQRGADPGGGGCGAERVEIFTLARETVLKRRSHYG